MKSMKDMKRGTYEASLLRLLAFPGVSVMLAFGTAVTR